MSLTSLISVSMATLLVSASALAGNSSSHESSMACGANSITIGMSTDDIKAICGQYWEPAFISVHTRPVLRKVADSEQENDQFEKWLYRIVEKQETHVIIKNDKIVKIFNTPQP